MIGRAEQNGPQGDGVNEDVSFTLNTIDRHGVAVFENHAKDSRFRDTGEVCQTVSATYGMGGNNQPLVVNQEPIPISTFNALRDDNDKRRAFGVGEPGEPQFSLTSAHQNAVCIENHPADSRCRISEDGVVQTLSSRMGTGGNNTPMVFPRWRLRGLPRMDEVGFIPKC